MYSTYINNPIVNERIKIIQVTEVTVLDVIGLHQILCNNLQTLVKAVFLHIEAGFVLGEPVLFQSKYVVSKPCI